MSERPREDHMEDHMAAYIDELEARIRELEARSIDTHKTIHEQAEALAHKSLEFEWSAGHKLDYFTRIYCRVLMRHAGLEGECEG